VTLIAQTHALNILIGDRWPQRVEHILATQLAQATPTVIAAWNLTASDGYPTSTPGAADRNNGGRGTSELTSVEAAVITRTRPIGAETALSAAVRAATIAVWHSDRKAVRTELKVALNITDQWQPPSSPKLAATLRCAGMVPTSAWPGRPECHNIADGGANSLGLCVACRRAYYRHEKAEG